MTDVGQETLFGFPFGFDPDRPAPKKPTLAESLRSGGVLIDRKGYDGKRALIPATGHRMATAIELGPRIRYSSDMSHNA